jgi:hypothetical protein
MSEKLSLSIFRCSVNGSRITAFGFVTDDRGLAVEVAALAAGVCPDPGMMHTTMNPVAATSRRMLLISQKAYYYLP